MARIDGLERLRAKAAALPDVAKQETMAALDKSADELVAFQKRLVPKGNPNDKGDLGASIHKEPGRHELAIAVVAGGENELYARYVEHGTSKMAARPFFFPAYRAIRRRIRSRITRASKKAAEKVAAGGN